MTLAVVVSIAPLTTTRPGTALSSHLLPAASVMAGPATFMIVQSGDTHLEWIFWQARTVAQVTRSPSQTGTGILIYLAGFVLRARSHCRLVQSFAHVRPSARD